MNGRSNFKIVWFFKSSECNVTLNKLYKLGLSQANSNFRTKKIMHNWIIEEIQTGS